MNERLLQYIWQFQYFNKNDLTTSEGELLEIVHPGTYNTHQGPDFKEGRILLHDHLWVGNIELHVQSSDWHRHMHASDKNYNNVILHVVWCKDEECSGQRFPTLVLSDRVPKWLLQQYSQWMNGEDFIACQSSAANVEELVWMSWKERLTIERLNRKSEYVNSLLKKNSSHWEEAFWWLLARNFGLYVNADAFEEMAMSIPLNLLAKHRLQVHQVEALLFGQAGLLEKEFSEQYPAMLKKEYAFLKSKYELVPSQVPMHFLRMRPACFPTVRIAQLAMLVHLSGNLFADIMQAGDIRQVKTLLDVTANDYWHYHFRFDEPAAYKPKTLGGAMTNTIIMNAAVVALYAYGKHHREHAYQQKALDWLAALPAENNSMIVQFKAIGIKPDNAFDTQALIELKAQYCDKKRCLDCAVGNAILNKNKS